MKIQCKSATLSVARNRPIFSVTVQLSPNPRSPHGSHGLSSCPTSTSARDATLDRPETEIDRPEAVLQSKPTGIVLRSQSRAGRSEVIVCAEVHPERPGVAPRPEPETARPEVEFAPVAGPSSDPTAVGTRFSAPPTRCGTETIEKTLSGYPFPARQEPETAPIPFTSFHTQQPGSFTR